MFEKWPNLGILIVPCPGKGVCADPRSGDTTFGVGGPGPPATDNGHQWSLNRGEEKTQRMAGSKEDDPTTASRDDYAQSECHCALYSSSVTYPLQEPYLIVLLVLYTGKKV